jgi:cyclin-dependent kinase 10
MAGYSKSFSWLSVTGQVLDLGLEMGYLGSLPNPQRAQRTLIKQNLGQCRSISCFEKLNQLGEGSTSVIQFDMLRRKTLTDSPPAYGIVYRARDMTSSKIVALKQVRISAEERQNGVPVTALREISILRSLKHQNIIDVIDVAVQPTAMDEIYMVMEYAEQVGSSDA